MAKECYSIKKIQKLDCFSLHQCYQSNKNIVPSKGMDLLKFIVKSPLGYFQISLSIINYWTK